MEEQLGPIQTQRLIRQYVADGRLIEAMVVAKSAVKALPDWLEFRLLLAEVYVAKGNPKQAISELEQLLALDPEFPGARPALDQLTLTPEQLQQRRADWP